MVGRPSHELDPSAGLLRSGNIAANSSGPRDRLIQRGRIAQQIFILDRIGHRRPHGEAALHHFEDDDIGLVRLDQFGGERPVSCWNGDRPAECLIQKRRHDLAERIAIDERCRRGVEICRRLDDRPKRDFVVEDPAIDDAAP